jgi:hypothetical protein
MKTDPTHLPEGVPESSSLQISLVPGLAFVTPPARVPEHNLKERRKAQAAKSASDRMLRMFVNTSDKFPRLRQIEVLRFA